MHIAIDCRLGGIAHAGIGRYITHLVRELISASPDAIRWTLICANRHQATEVLGRQLKNPAVSVAYVSARHYTVREQLYLLPVLARIRPDIFHIPHFNAPVGYWGRTVVTIHDLLWHEMRGSTVTTLPVWQYRLKHFLYTLVTKRSVTHASAVLVPSKSVAETVTSFYPEAATKISITKEGVASNFVRDHVPPYNWLKRRSAGLLYVGSLYPHKNIEIVMTALKKLPNTHLTIVGARSAFVSAAKTTATNLGIIDRVTFQGNVSDTELARLYTTCAALVQPSRSEGFGLTGVEAMASGTPVLCSNIPIFREIYGEHAVYFDPYSADSFVAAFAQLSHSKMPAMVTKAHAYAKTFNWQTTAKQTLAVYQEVLSSTE